MTWTIELEDRAIKELSKLEKQTQYKIINYLKARILNDPRNFGKPLLYNKFGLWRYRVGDYRIICKIEDQRLSILIVSVAHRKNIYK